jgi:ribosomal-protein-serine acetyltransferase
VFAVRLDDALKLRLLEAGHAQLLFDALDRNRTELRTWLPWVDGVRSVDDLLAFIRTVEQEFAQGSQIATGVWQQGHVVGVISLRIYPWYRSGEISYWLVAEVRGQGIATRATWALVDHGFNELDLHRIQIQCATRNRASRAIPERLGFTLEGILREAERVDGQFNDLAVYSMLRREWGHVPGSSTTQVP